MDFARISVLTVVLDGKRHIVDFFSASAGFRWLSPKKVEAAFFCGNTAIGDPEGDFLKGPFVQTTTVAEVDCDVCRSEFRKRLPSGLSDI